MSFNLNCDEPIECCCCKEKKDKEAYSEYEHDQYCDECVNEKIDNMELCSSCLNSTDCNDYARYEEPGVCDSCARGHSWHMQFS